VRDLDKPRNVIPSPDTTFTTSMDALIDDPEIDIVVELAGGVEFPRTLITRALNSGKSVVTANKALLAEHGPELFELAADKGLGLYYEASVAGSIPIIQTLKESLAGNRIKALTGINCDRLAEEQKRGITIELGFAYLDLNPQLRLGIIDVPGHERFVKNMVSGAAGIDFVLLVIAADEGIMPHTREHLEICSLLGIRAGLVALTKTDMVEEEWLELVREEVQAYLA
ncbi:hypothetical protein JWG42_18300, partial [Desulfoprunum benzoelyticum]|uniref:GTP-binding protein n=1 Tax=Desulfoprunum benzoelyticum TaxID=1506996 RepID=UPI001F05F0EF